MPSDQKLAEPNSTHTPEKKGPTRRIAAALLIGVIVCVIAWIAAFSFATSLLVGSGSTVVLIGAGSWSDAVEAVLDWLGSVLAAILGVFAAIVTAVFSLFDL